MRYLLILSLIGVMASCSKRETEELNLELGYSYYPLEVGRSWIYQVDSVIFRPDIGRIRKDTTTTQMREVIVDETLDLTGQPQYIVERYERPAAGTSWEIRKVFTLSRSAQQAFRTEDNLRFIKLVFPPRQGKTWNGNIYFDIYRLFPVGGEYLDIFRDWEYRLTETGQAVNRAGLSFQDVITVQQANLNVATDYRFASEQYARGVGMIYREWFIAGSQCQYCCGGDTGPNCQNLAWEDRAEKGFYIKQTLLSYQ